jgi:hypothetical protein
MIAVKDASRVPPDDRGFGVIEIVISLFLLGLLAVSFIPVLINGWKTSARNTTIATATQLVNQQMGNIRAVRSPTSTPPSCADITTFVAGTFLPSLDPRGVSLQPQWDSVTCPAAYPGVVRVRVTVTETGEITPIASAVTLIFVSSASGATP